MTNRANLLDLMSPEDKAQALASYEKRMSGNTEYRKNLKIPPLVYLMAELGYYFGWGAIRDFKRGYVEDFDESTGERRKIPLTMEETNLLTEGARKIWHSHVIDDARATHIASGSIMSKRPGDAFKKGIKPYEERAKP